MLWMSNSFSFQGRSVVLMVICILLAYLTSLLVEYPFIRIYKRNVGFLKNDLSIDRTVPGNPPISGRIEK
jgi:hypothetical protein